MVASVWARTRLSCWRIVPTSLLMGVTWTIRRAAPEKLDDGPISIFWSECGDDVKWNDGSPLLVDVAVVVRRRSWCWWWSWRW